MFGALSNSNRLIIFIRLLDCCSQEKSCSADAGMGACISELSDGLGLAASTVSHHLKELRRTGLISMSRLGRQVECRINEEALEEILSLINTYQQKKSSWLINGHLQTYNAEKENSLEMPEHNIQITYCVEWGFLTKATSLVAAIESAFNINATLIEGHNGIYQVSVNNKVMYSNQGQCSQGFPDDALIIEQIGQLIGVQPEKVTQPISQLDQEQGPACSLPRQDDTAS